MTPSQESDQAPSRTNNAPSRLNLTILQIADDASLATNRTDGTGWDWSWAAWQRDWMDATTSRFAYRCLPLTIANQTGLWVKNPVGFTAAWRGSEAPGNIDFRFDEAPELWSRWISNEFGAGIITWNTPFLFRTEPAGSRLLISGPANVFKPNVQALTAILESDWMTMSFTMNWKIVRPGEPVRFEAGEPLFQAYPMVNNVCADLESASVVYKKLDDDPDISRSYREWDQSRKSFMQRRESGQTRADEWQRDYFLGRDASGRPSAPVHMTKVRPPQVRYEGTATPPVPKDDASQRAAAQPALQQPPAANDQTVNPTAHAASTNPAQTAPEYRPINDDWRRWIAENLMLGAAREGILQTMVAGGLSPTHCAAEIDLACASPYLRGVERVSNRLKKREWLLSAYRKLSRLHPDSGECPRRHQLSRAEFIAEFYSANRPVIITGMMDGWPALRTWSLDNFAERFGDREVEVQIGRDASGNFEPDREKFRRKMLFADFVQKVRTAGVTNDLYITASNNSANKATLPELWDDIEQIPEYLNAHSPHNGFFWFGPAGTITPFHHDLTNNFMAQVLGRKRVKLVPSWDIPLMRNFVDVYCDVDGRTTPAAPSPIPGQPQVIECELAPGEILFLPIGCLHFVEALDVSATVSFTNFDFDDNNFVTSYENNRYV